MVRGALFWIAAIAITLGWLGVLAYVVGEIVSDRHRVLQWLSWIPTEAALAFAIGSLLVALLGLVVGRCLARDGWRRSLLVRSTRVSGALVAMLSLVLLTVEHRPWRSAPEVPADALGVLHWNPRWPNRARSLTVAQSLELLIADRETDLIVLTDPGRLLFDGRAAELALSGFTVARSGAFAVLTSLPIRELRTLVRFDRVDITLLRIDASPTGVGTLADDREPGELVVWLVDLPSNPRNGRMELMRDLRARLDEINAPAPDLVIGDMNLTRRSAALRTLAPGTRHAFGEAGRGWGATFWEPYPLWHVDHVMLAESLVAVDYSTIHSGASRHRAQHAIIRARPRPSVVPASPSNSN